MNPELHQQISDKREKCRERMIETKRCQQALQIAEELEAKECAEFEQLLTEAKHSERQAA